MAFDIAEHTILGNPVKAFFQGKALALSQEGQQQDMALKADQNLRAQDANTRANQDQANQNTVTQNALTDRQAKQALAGAQQVLASDHPLEFIKADPQFKQFISDYESHHGESIDSLGDDGVRKAAQGLIAHTAGQLGMSPQDLQPKDEYTLKAGETRFRDGKQIASAGPEQLTPYQQAQLKQGEDRLAIERHKADKESASASQQLVTRPVEGDDSGKVQDFAWNPKTLEKTPIGEPYTKDAGNLGQRAEQQFMRVVISGNEATQAIKNISELPMGASTGLLGIGGHPGTTLMSAPLSALKNKVSTQDTQSVNVMITGLQRSLAGIEAAGLAPPGSLTEHMNGVVLKEGDTQITKLRRMAEAAQITTKGLEVYLKSPRVPAQQKQQVQGIINEMQQAVPYTQHDITMLEQSKNSKATIGDIAKAKGLGGPSVGTVQDGYKFKGGNPADPHSWEPAS